MAKAKYWRNQAQQAIQHALNLAKKQGKEGQEIVNMIDAAYPFEQRSNYPYTAWLSERRRILKELGLYQPKQIDYSVYHCKYCQDRPSGCLLCPRVPSC